jgi:multiple sugar transport system permease protein
MNAKRKQYLVGLGFLAPFALMFTIFIVVPVLAAAWLSVVQLDLANKASSKFVGAQNFRDALKDDLFWQAVHATLNYALLMVPSVIIIGTALALGIHNMSRGKNMVRALIYLPAMLNVAATGILWQFFFSGEFGLFNFISRRVGGPSIPFLSDKKFAMPSVVTMSMWWTVGATTMIILAAVQNIPKSFFEAAALDGAGGGKIFSRITIPILRPVLIFVFITTTISAFQMFGQAMILTGGGPEFSTRGLVQYMYETAFNGYRFGYGAAISWLLFAMILVFSVSQTRLIGGRDKG